MAFQKHGLFLFLKNIKNNLKKFEIKKKKH